MRKAKEESVKEIYAAEKLFIKPHHLDAKYSEKGLFKNEPKC